MAGSTGIPIFPLELRQLDVQEKKKKPNSRNHLNSSQSPIKLECLVSSSFHSIGFCQKCHEAVTVSLFHCLVLFDLLGNVIAFLSEELVEDKIVLGAIWIVLKILGKKWREGPLLTK